MAPKCAKRAAQAMKAAPPAKVAKVTKVAKSEAPKPQAVKSDPLLEPIRDVIEKADGLPESCRKMLLAMVPHSLVTPSDERHEVQSRAVAMVGDLVETTKSEMQAALDRETAAVSEVEATKSKLDAAIEEANARLASSIEIADSKQTAHAEAEKTTCEKQIALDEAKATQQRDDAALEAAKTGKAECEAVFNDHVKVLRDEELEKTAADAHQAALLKFVQTVNLDSSLLTSLPTACAKPPSTRGAFDQMVFQELEKELNEHIRKLAEQVAQGLPAQAERAKAVEVAQADVDAARDAQRLAADEVSSADSGREEAAKALAAAKTEANNFVSEYEKATKARDEKVLTLEQFEKLNVACFAELRDKVSQKEAAPEEVSQVAPEEVAQDAVMNEVVAKEAPATAPAITVEVGGA